MISQKLDLLMKVTNTKNSALGKALCFDASYIGRIRSGKRGLPKHQDFIAPAAAYFSRNLNEPYQQKTMAEAICPGRPWPESITEAEKLLMKWLSDNRVIADPVGNLLRSLSNLTSKSPTLTQQAVSADLELLNNANFYYGNAGKREGVLTFLSALATIDSPQKLLLYSDEDMTWLYEDDNFVRKWAMLLIKIISKGGNIKIIHTVSRNIGDMLEAVQKWLPLYLSSAIEPYYYPKLRDGIYHRTLFIAHGKSALISDSIKNHTQEALNILINNPTAVKALECEFQDYFSLCKPLMQIFNLRNSDLFRQQLSEFESSDENIVMAHSSLSHITMPESVALSMAKRCNKQWIIECQIRASSQLNNGKHINEVLHLTKPETVRKGRHSVLMCDLFDEPTLCYTLEEYKLHLENVLKLLKRNENYNVVISDKVPENVLIYAKEDIGVIVAKIGPPSNVFGISEQSMTAAFWEYLQRMKSKTKKEKTIQVLNDYLESL